MSKTEWNGQGLPPIGCECLVIGEMGDDTYYPCKIIAHTEFQGYQVAIFQTERTISGSSEGKFSPLRAQKEEERYQALIDITKVLTSQSRDNHVTEWADNLLKAIEEGKITGVGKF